MFLKKLQPLLISIIFIGITVLFYSNFSLSTIYIFKSRIYKIEDNHIYNISPNTNIELYKKYFDIKNYKLKIENPNSNEYISNGSKTILLDKNNKLVYTFINIIKGDIVSDGIINDDDLNKFKQYLNNNYYLEDYQIKSLDINDDNKIDNDDLILLNNALEEGIRDIEVADSSINILEKEQYRLVATPNPNYGIITNLKWSIQNESIASIDESGLITSHKLGNTSLIVEDINGKIKKEIPIIVDNTIKLSSSEGISFELDEELAIPIRSLDYKNIECKSSNEIISTCRIDNKTLYLKNLSAGNAIITVTSPKYGSTTYKLTTYSSYLDFIPEYHCMHQNKKDLINLDYIYQDIKISNNKLTTNTHFNNNQFFIESLNTTGKEELIFNDQNNNTKKMIIDIYNLNIPSIGAFIPKGTNTSANILAQNTTKLTCISPDKSIADCYIEDNKLYVTGINKGEVTLKITNTNTYNNKEYNCGETTFLAVITN